MAFRNVPSFVLEAGLPVKIGGRTILVDVAFGGAFYAIVDAESAGLPVTPGKLADLRRVGHGDQARGRTAPAGRPSAGRRTEGHLRHDLHGARRRIPTRILHNVTIFADAEVDRSPCGTGTAAVMAVLSEMGVLGDDAPASCTRASSGRSSPAVSSRHTQVGDCAAIVPEIEGSAWITGEHTFLIDGDDPLKAGFRL